MNASKFILLAELFAIITAEFMPAQDTPTPARRAGATGVFVAQLRPDGTVQKVLVSRSTGNHVVDANTVKGLSLMRFPPETLTKEQRAKGQIVVRMAPGDAHSAPSSPRNQR